MHAARREDVVALSGLLDARRAADTRRRLYERIDGADGDVVVDLTEVEATLAELPGVVAAVVLHDDVITAYAQLDAPATAASATTSAPCST